MHGQQSIKIRDSLVVA